MGEQRNPGDSTSFLVPQVSTPVGGWPIGSIGDYFGLPTVGQVSAGKSVTHSALPFRAYNLIFNEWFRDENLVTSFIVDTGDKGRWEVTSIYRGQYSQTSATLGVWYNIGSEQLYIPKGGWETTISTTFLFNSSLVGAWTAITSLSTSSSSESTPEFTIAINAANTLQGGANLTRTRTIVSSGASYYLIGQCSQNTGGGTINLFQLNTPSTGLISAIPSGL